MLIGIGMYINCVGVFIQHMYYKCGEMNETDSDISLLNAAYWESYLKMYEISHDNSKASTPTSHILCL